MRTLILIFIVSLLFIFVCSWHLDINSENSRKAELRSALNNTIENVFSDFVMKKIYSEKNINELMEEFNKNLLLAINSNGKIIVKLVGADLDNGIIFIRVENIYDKTIYGEGKVVCEKAVILEEY